MCQDVPSKPSHTCSFILSLRLGRPRDIVVASTRGFWTNSCPLSLPSLSVRDRLEESFDEESAGHGIPSEAGTSHQTTFWNWMKTWIARNRYYLIAVLLSFFILATLAHMEGIGYHPPTGSVVCRFYETNPFFWWPYHLLGVSFTGCITNDYTVQDALMSRYPEYISSVIWWFLLPATFVWILRLVRRRITSRQ